MRERLEVVAVKKAHDVHPVPLLTGLLSRSLDDNDTIQISYSYVSIKTNHYPTRIEQMQSWPRKTSFQEPKMPPRRKMMFPAKSQETTVSAGKLFWIRLISNKISFTYRKTVNPTELLLIKDGHDSPFCFGRLKVSFFNIKSQQHGNTSWPWLHYFHLPSWAWRSCRCLRFRSQASR